MLLCANLSKIKTTVHRTDKIESLKILPLLGSVFEGVMSHLRQQEEYCPHCCSVLVEVLFYFFPAFNFSFVQNSYPRELTGVFTYRVHQTRNLLCCNMKDDA